MPGERIKVCDIRSRKSSVPCPTTNFENTYAGYICGGRGGRD